MFQEDGYDDIVLAKLSSGATAMKEKLVVYASSQLPGGAYWDPDPEVKSILSTIKPTNDLCESILGLNDYLTTAIPNMTQFTKSTMVAVKKNKTIKWLQTLPEAQQDDLTLFAMQKRRDVTVAYKEEQIKLKRRRQELMIQAKERRELLEKKAAEERESLSKIHLITSVEELELLFADIDDSEGSAASKSNKKLAILKEQVRVRKKVVNQTHLRKKRPLPELIREVKEFIASSDVHDIDAPLALHEHTDPFSLVGRRVYHRFIDESNSDSEDWYERFILGYNATTKLHEIAYVEEEDNFHFNLMDDLVAGDLKFDD